MLTTNRLVGRLNVMINRKEQILETAAELLQSRSFSSFSYKDIMDRIGIAKPTIHHHFSTKADLGLALIDHYIETTKVALEGINQKHRKPWDRIEGYFNWMSGIMLSGNKICPTGILQAEYNVIPEKMRKSLSFRTQFIQTWLATVLADGKAEGTMEFPGKPEDHALLIHSAIQGALQQARAEGAKKFTTVIHQLRKGMEVKK